MTEANKKQVEPTRAGSDKVKPVLTTELKHLLNAIRIASYSNSLPTEAILLGIMRHDKTTPLRHGRQVAAVLNANPTLFRRVLGTDRFGRNRSFIYLTPEGSALLDMLEASDEILVPLELCKRKTHPSAPTMLTLDGYFTNTTGTKEAVTLVFQSKILLLNIGNTLTTKADEINEVVGYVKCMWKQCNGETLDFQRPRPVSNFPHIKHLIRYVVTHLGATNSMKELEGACIHTMKTLFPGTQELQSKDSDYAGKTSIVLKVPISRNNVEYVCPKCERNSCNHVGRVRK
jgi:hypothetical protein